MNKIMGKAEVLIEALPYIQKFNRKIIVVKYGGSAMSNEGLQGNQPLGGQGRQGGQICERP